MAKYHQKKEISKAIEYAVGRGWTYEEHKRGHACGSLKCPGVCLVFVSSTPRNAGNHAKDIRRKIDNCPCGT
ncbi:hypothetical protein [Stratiformator vulcanicus]|uniref:YcfA-like protein n=1 Tax=Stratiformator vulcanicus TaxID=2527980 RepID=A0A517R744_9PLAN|nr:hypothetical protein [Stratiformator vulcanicus]QDT39716.1 hypothetical protein Pan189_41250 [Stratiformator vulcanicus]